MPLTPEILAELKEKFIENINNLWQLTQKHETIEQPFQDWEGKKYLSKDGYHYLLGSIVLNRFYSPLMMIDSYVLGSLKNVAEETGEGVANKQEMEEKFSQQLVELKEYTKTMVDQTLAEGSIMLRDFIEALKKGGYLKDGFVPSDKLFISLLETEYQKVNDLIRGISDIVNQK